MVPASSDISTLEVISMGNTKNSAGKRVFDDVYTFPQDSQDLADDLYEANNVRVGTSAARQALPVAQQKPSMLWVETDGDKRIMRTDGAGAWTDVLSSTVVSVAGFSTGWTAGSGYEPFMLVQGKRRTLVGAATRGAGGSLGNILTVPTGHRPSTARFLGAHVNGASQYYELLLTAAGTLQIPSGYGSASVVGLYPIGCSWEID